MKARIKETGIVVELHSWSHSAMSPTIYSITYLENGNFTALRGIDKFEILPDEPETLTTEIDWEQRRYEIAKEAFDTLEFHSPNGISNAVDAVNKADELILQLRNTPMP